MWIALRLVFAVIAFVLRAVPWRRKPKQAGTYHDTPYYLRMQENKGATIGFWIGMPLSSPAPISVRFKREGRADDFFKRIGMSREHQTGDRLFDDQIYVVSDHPFVAKLLDERADLRTAITDALAGGFERIELDGKTLWMWRIATTVPAVKDFDLLRALREAAKPLETNRTRDPFVWRARIIRGLIWAIFGYGIGAYIDVMINRVGIHLDHDAIIWRGLVVAIALFVVIVGATYVLMRKSSRGHRVLTESAIVLFFGLPITGMQLVADTNRAFAGSPVELTRVVDRCDERLGGRRGTSYRLHLLDPGAELPKTIAVGKELCQAVKQGDRVAITIVKGAWGLTYYREIKARDATWQP